MKTDRRRTKKRYASAPLLAEAQKRSQTSMLMNSLGHMAYGG